MLDLCCGSTLRPEAAALGLWGRRRDSAPAGSSSLVLSSCGGVGVRARLSTTRGSVAVLRRAASRRRRQNTDRFGSGCFGHSSYGRPGHPAHVGRSRTIGKAGHSLPGLAVLVTGGSGVLPSSEAASTPWPAGTCQYLGLPRNARSRHIPVPATRPG